MTGRFRAVVFDFDYTLADSSRAVIECVNFAFQKMGLAPASENAVRRTIGLSLPETLVRLAGEEHGERAEEFRRLFRQRSDQVMVDWTELLPAVPPTLDKLRRCGLQLGIVSTKFRHRIETVLRRENLLEQFDAIIGGDDVDEFKPHPRGLLEAIEQLQSVPSRTLYVGDSVTDAETARRAGVACVAVLSGTTRRDEFHRYRLFRILENVADLPPVLGC